MQPLNAIDAIAPAFTRTHELLLKPFRWGRSWKLAASQYLGLVGAAFMPFPLVLAFFPMDGIVPGLAHAAILFAAAIATLVFFAFFYVGVRMQFVNFEMVVTRAEFVAPMWRRYGTRVWPVIGLKTALGTAIPLAMFPLLRNSVLHMTHSVLSMPVPARGTSVDVEVLRAFAAQIVGFYALMACAFIVLKLFTSSFEDFAMPFFIMEPIGLMEAVARGCRMIAKNPLQCVLYLVLKLVLTFVGGIVWYISLIVATIAWGLVALVLFGVGALISGVMHGGDAVHLLLVAAAIVAGVALYAAIFWYMLGTIGYGAMLLESYGIYFLAGRYPMLGNLMEAGPGGPFTPPPVFPSQDESNDDDGGPPMPMDPAVA